MIVTRWHKFMESVDKIVAGSRSEDDHSRRFFENNVSYLKSIGEDIPIFVVDHDSVKFQESDLNSFFEMCDALGNCPLPFNEFVVECHMENDVTNFLCVSGANSKQIVFTLMSQHEKTAVALIDETEPFDLCVKNAPLFSTFMYYGTPLEERVRRAATSALEVSVLFLRYMILNLNTRGIDTEVIPGPRFLNKQREHKSKPRIPDVTVIKIGHYYNRFGEKEFYDQRRPVRIHWRRGHTRNVWCGTGDNRRQESRYIFPCLVNYAPGDAIPPQQLRVLS